MKNIKLIAGFSVFGFCLSFFFGLFSKSGFGRIILFAFIFALVFAVLAFALQFVFDKILDLNGNEDFSSQGAASESSSLAGQNIDITVEDEEFPAEEGEPQFFVGTNHQMLEESDMKNGSKLSAAEADAKSAVSKAGKPLFSSSGNGDLEKQGADSASALAKEKILSANVSASSSYTAASNNPAEKTEEPSAKKTEGFVPINLGETPKNISGTEARLIQEVNPASYDSTREDSSLENRNSMDDELDTLPDLEEITSSAPKITISSADEDSSSDDGVSVSSKDVSEVTEGKDVTLMAKAISTLLAKDT